MTNFFQLDRLDKTEEHSSIQKGGEKMAVLDVLGLGPLQFNLGSGVLEEVTGKKLVATIEAFIPFKKTLILSLNEEEIAILTDQVWKDGALTLLRKFGKRGLEVLICIKDREGGIKNG